jgi:uncharacterized membrane protein YfcA
MNADHWYLLPVGCSIAVLAMSSGISAGNLWVPVYLLWARFEPPLAFWMTLTTMLCGYGSGVVRNLRQGTINRRCILRYLPCTVPAAVAGGYLSPAIDVSWLIFVFSVFVLGYGAHMLRPATWRFEAVTPSAWERAGVRDYTIALVGGTVHGMIAVGLGELMLPSLLTDRKLYSPAEAVGSTVLVIFVTSLAAAMVRLHGSFLTALGEQHTVLLGAIIFAAPGVILGGQLGPAIARRLNARALRLYVAIILLLVGLLMLLRLLATAGFIR